MEKTIRRIGTIGLLIVFSFAAAGCGYRFAGSGEGFPANVKHIYVEMLQNRTSQTGLENTMTNQIVFEFTRRNKRALANELTTADALLSGVITSKSVQTVAPRGKDAAAQRRVTLRMNLKLTKVDGEVVWLGTGMSDNEVYPVASDKLGTEQNERDAIQVLTARLAERIYNRMTDNF